MTINPIKVPQWDYSEISLQAEPEGNPFKEIQFSALFTLGSHVITMPGFYDGAGTWKIRFMPPLPGTWQFQTQSNQDALDGHTGEIEAIEAEEGVHGPVSVREGIHFAYADGTPYYPVGTTCYVWNHQGKALEEKTLASLKASPFNKIRFCVFPKRYTFNHNEPEIYPFPGEVNVPWKPSDQDDYTPKQRDFWDTETFIPEYFRHIDECVLQLRNLGIEADLILFHPYDFGAWGFDCLSEEVNNRLLDYLVARLAAFRNIWWSFANEYDLFQNKALHEWGRYMKRVQDLDPFEHLRSIHNCKGFYDHSLPWVTHCSIQSESFEQIPQWLDKYSKPVVIDECGYEGNISRDWGNLSPRQMVDYFWKGFTTGAYVGHGETYVHPEDILWWSKGGELHGQSPVRIAFLRDIVEDFPNQGLTPFKRGTGFIPNLGKATGLGLYPEYGLYYFGLRQPSFREVFLPEEGLWGIDIIDTWEMTVHSLGRDFSGITRIELPGKEGIALRISKQTGAESL